MASKKVDRSEILYQIARNFDDLKKYDSLARARGDFYNAKAYSSDRDYDKYNQDYLDYQRSARVLKSKIENGLPSDIKFVTILKAFRKLSRDDYAKINEIRSNDRLKKYATTVDLTPEQEAEFDRLEDMGIFTSDEIMRKVLGSSYRESSESILDRVVEHFGTTDTPYDGSTFILPSGYFLDISKYKIGHSIVDTWLDSQGLLPYKNEFAGGSKILQSEGCIRCDTRKAYIELPKDSQPTQEVYQSILIWLDYLSDKSDRVMILPYRGFAKDKTYHFSEYIPDEVVEKVRRFYIFGELTEGLTGIRYPRNKVGESIVKIDPFRPNKFNPNAEKRRLMRMQEATRQELVSKARQDTKTRYNKRLDYRPVTFDGVNIRELFTNDDLVFTTRVGDYLVVIAVRGVLSELKSLVGSKGRCTYADVLKAINSCLGRDGIRVNCQCADFCLTGDTRISLLDGRELSILEIVDEFNKGKELWVFSTDENGDFKPGLITDAWLTGQSDNIYRITLDNGESVTCTGNHPFMLRDGSYKNAQDLEVGQSLMSLEYEIKVASTEKLEGAQDVYDITVDQWHNFRLSIGVIVSNTYRFKYWAYKGGYLYGDPGKAAEFPEKTNPEGRGSMCKHLASVLSNRIWIVKVAAAVNNYIRMNVEQCAPYLYNNPEEVIQQHKDKLARSKSPRTDTPEDTPDSEETSVSVEEPEEAPKEPLEGDSEGQDDSSNAPSGND